MNRRKSTKKKVTLIQTEPKRANVYSAFAYPGLALPILGTVLKEKGYNVKVYVDAIRPWDWDRILTSDLIGITVNSSEVKESYLLAERLRLAGADAADRRAGAGGAQSDDEIVPVVHGRRLYEAAREPKAFLVLAGGHNEGFIFVRSEWVERLDAFLSAHWPAGR